MGRALSFLRRPSRDRRLFYRALFWLWTVRLGLAALPFQSVLRIQQRAFRADRSSGAVEPAMLERVRWAVERAGRFVPGPPCLTRALAGQVLFARHGVDSELRIGVAREPERKLVAHAWLERRGRVVLGDAQPERFTSLSEIPARIS